MEAQGLEEQGRQARPVRADPQPPAAGRAPVGRRVADDRARAPLEGRRHDGAAPHDRDSGLAELAEGRAARGADRGPSTGEERRVVRPRCRRIVYIELLALAADRRF